MNMIKEHAEGFIYTNRGPEPYNVVRSNLIRLRWEGDKLIQERLFLSDNGKLSGPIDATFEHEEINAIRIAQNIHWGCCGWQAGAHQIQPIVRKVREFIQSK